MKLEQLQRSYTSTANQQKACKYLQQWMGKWRPKEWLAFIRLYRNDSTNSMAGFSFANAMQYFASKAYQKQAFAYLEQTLQGFDNGAVLKAFEEQYAEKVKGIDHFKYFQQMDSAYVDYRTSSCNVSACSMLENSDGKGNIKNDDDLLACFIAEGTATTNHDAMTRILLNKFDFASRFIYNGTFAELDAKLAEGKGAVLGILHHGTAYAPYGNGHMIYVHEKQGDSYIVGDPYGNLLDGYTSAVENGNKAKYPKNELAGRWTVEGDGSGWVRYAI